MKGNDGRAARRKMIHRWLIVGSSLAGLLLVLRLTGVIPFDRSHEHGSSRGSGRLLRDPHAENARQFRHALHHQFSDKDEAQVLQQVLAAELQLVDLTVVEEELLRSPTNSYAGVYGKFCKLDWTIRKRDPSAGKYFLYPTSTSNGKQII